MSGSGTRREFSWLGLPPLLRYRPAPAYQAPPRLAPWPTASPGPATIAVAIAARHELHHGLAALRSWRAHHPEGQSLLVVSDGDGNESRWAPDVPMVSGRQVMGEDLAYAALKLEAADLASLLAPFAVRHALTGFNPRRVVLLPARAWILAPLRALDRELVEHAVVLTARFHATAPGLCGLRAGAQARRFVERWISTVAAPGYFAAGRSQESGWALTSDGAAVLKDAASSMDRAGLEDHNLRWRSFDDPRAGDSWSVDGRPLACFDFAEYSRDHPFRLERHPRRPIQALPSLQRLIAAYDRALIEAGAHDFERLPYGFDRFASGLEIDARMRRLWCRHEAYLRHGDDPWSADGEPVYAQEMLSPLPHVGGFLPLLFHQIYDERPDLRAAFPRAAVDPTDFLRWIGANGAHEYGYEELVDRHRPTLPSLPGARNLLAARPAHTTAAVRPRQPLGADRAGWLKQDGALQELAGAAAAFDLELYVTSAVDTVRRLHRSRADLREAFPEPLFEDSEGWVRWLRTHGRDEYDIPPAMADACERCAQGQALVRIYSYLRRNLDLQCGRPLGLVGDHADALALSLLAARTEPLEYDEDDVAAFLWGLETDPGRALGLVFELPVNACRRPSSFQRAGQNEILGTLRHDPHIRRALRRYRAEHPDEGGSAPIRPPGPAHAFSWEGRLEAKRLGFAEPARGTGPAPRRLRRGVNAFGMYRCPTGTGYHAEGLARAIEAGGWPVARNPTGGAPLDRGLRPADMVRRFAPDYDVNLFVTSPFVPDVPLLTLPPWRRDGRTNVAALIWEQRDADPLWADQFEGFDQVWAQSSFNAAGFRGVFDCPVHVVPNPLDLDALPRKAAKDDVGLDVERFVFLFVFNPVGALQRKNPAALIRAFCRAFDPSEPVELVLRAGYGQKLQNRPEWSDVVDAISPGSKVRFRFEALDRVAALRLLSAADCYASLHRAEGFGYTLAEAMAYGVPTIATAYSGNLEFMDRENSFLVEAREVEVERPEGPFQRGSVWGEPDVDHAAALMRHVYERREESALVAERGQRTVRERLALPQVGALCRRLLEHQGRAAATADVAEPRS
jgi:glycosyltransferase involved in cell wall biosynthesis